MIMIQKGIMLIKIWVVEWCIYLDIVITQYIRGVGFKDCAPLFFMPETK